MPPDQYNACCSGGGANCSQMAVKDAVFTMIGRRLQTLACVAMDALSALDAPSVCAPVQLHSPSVQPCGIPIGMGPYSCLKCSPSNPRSTGGCVPTVNASILMHLKPVLEAARLYAHTAAADASAHATVWQLQTQKKQLCGIQPRMDLSLHPSWLEGLQKQSGGSIHVSAAAPRNGKSLYISVSAAARAALGVLAGTSAYTIHCNSSIPHWQRSGTQTMTCCLHKFPGAVGSRSAQLCKVIIEGYYNVASCMCTFHWCTGSSPMSSVSKLLSV